MLKNKIDNNTLERSSLSSLTGLWELRKEITGTEKLRMSTVNAKMRPLLADKNINQKTKGDYVKSFKFNKSAGLPINASHGYVCVRLIHLISCTVRRVIKIQRNIKKWLSKTQYKFKEYFTLT